MGLSKEDILVRVKGEINKVSTFLSLSREATTILLIRYHWNIDTLFDEWFADEEKVRKDYDLPDNPIIIDQSSTSVCGICGGNNLLDDKEQNTAAQNCGHVFCETCWKNHISKSINEGQGDCSMILRCPQQQQQQGFCRGLVDQSRIESLISDDEKKIYEHYLVASYVSESRKGTPMIKWCPGPGCSRAVETKPFPGRRRIYDVTCDCSYKFCFECLEEAHSPVDCETLIKWRNSHKSQSSNLRWAYGKACPKCFRPLEMNISGDCGPPGNYEFCDRDACKSFEMDSIDDMWDKGINERRKARESLVEYEKFSDRVAAHEDLRQKALVELQRLKIEDLQELSEIYNPSKDDLMFVVDAWAQIAECWRILKWAHVYSYYLSEDEREEFLEQTLVHAEAAAKRLYNLAEISLIKDLLVTVTPQVLQEVRQELSDLTLETRNYFENLVGAVLQKDRFT